MLTRRSCCEAGAARKSFLNAITKESNSKPRFHRLAGPSTLLNSGRTILTLRSISTYVTSS